VDAYLSKVQERLKKEGFGCQENVADGEPFLLVAHRSRIELTKFASNVDTFFFFTHFPSLTSNELRAYSGRCFDHALQARGLRPPRGLFEAVFSYAVALVDQAADETTQAVRNDLPPKHWSAAETQVIYDLGAKKLYYFEKTPLWGAFYYGGQRKTIQRLLA
jgi:hypothetical protein